MGKWLTIFFLFLVIPGSAQSPVFSDYIVQHYTEEDGLPNNIVNCSLKSRDGFLWFGTWYGLSRFDGTHFHNFTTAFYPTSDQPPRKIETLAEDATGNIWIKTVDWKLSVFFKQTESFEDVYDELKPFSRNLQIIKIQSDGHGHVILLTKNKNLLLASTTSKGEIHIRLIASSRGNVNDFNDQLIRDLVTVKNGYASYVGRDYKIFVEPLVKGSPKSVSYWTKFFNRRAENINHKISRYKNFTVSSFSHLTNFQYVRTSSYTFFLSESGRLFRINPLTRQINPVGELTSVRFFSMYYDARNDILWLTSTNDGVYSLVFPPRQFRLIKLPPAVKAGVRSMYQFPNGNVWVGTRSKNVYILDTYGRLVSTLSYEKYHIGSVYYMMKDSRQRLWLSTKGDGLVEAVPDSLQSCGYRFVHFMHDAKNVNSISGNNVYITHEDSRHHLWIGTLDGGLNLLKEQQGHLFFLNKYNGLKDYPDYGLYMEVRNMAEDRYHRMWVGTIDGLMSFDTRFSSPDKIHFETYRKTETNTLANGDIYAMFKDREQNIWICTFGGGLAEIKGLREEEKLPKFRRIGTREGLQNDVIISMLQDYSGRIWLVGTNSLASYNVQTNRIRNIGRSDGFPAVTIEETATLLNTRSKEIWLGTKEGILAFRPDRFIVKKKTYPVYIVGFEVNNRDVRSFVTSPILDRSVSYVDHVELKHDQNMFTLEFAALNYISPQSVTYRYKLEGFDENWHYCGKNHIASYSNVAPGTYIFTVQAMDASNPGVLSSRNIQIKILPPWWATWWAYAIYTILFLVLLYFAVRYVRYQIRLKNDLYVQTKIAEFKRQYKLEQEDAKFLKQVNQTIDDHLVDPDFDIDRIAQSLGMSRSAFFKRLKSLTSLAPSEFIKDRKLSYAVELLKQSDLAISDIAYQAGFSDVGYFGKCFRKKYGMSPRDFKKQ